MSIAAGKAGRGRRRAAARADPAGAKRGAPCGRRRWPTTSGRSGPAWKAAATSRSAEQRSRAHPRGGADAAGDRRLRQCHPVLHRGADERRRDLWRRRAHPLPARAGRSTRSRSAARNFTLHGQDPQPRHADPGQARALRHGGCGRASGRRREARIPRIAAAGHLRRRAHRRRARQHPLLPAADGAARHSRSARYGFQHALRLRDGHVQACRHVASPCARTSRRRWRCSTRSPAARRTSARGRSSPTPTASSCRR